MEIKGQIIIHEINFSKGPKIKCHYKHKLVYICKIKSKFQGNKMTLTGKEKIISSIQNDVFSKVPKTQGIISSPPHPTILLHSTLKILNITANKGLTLVGQKFLDF